MENNLYKNGIKFFALFFVMGCGVNPDGTIMWGPEGSNGWRMTSSQEVIDAYDKKRQENYAKKCRGYGFTDGTVDMAKCIQNEVLQRKRDQEISTAPIVVPAYQPPKQTICRPIGKSIICQ